MPKDASARDEPFDLERLRELVEMMEQHGLTEINLTRGDEKWRLRRGPLGAAPASPGFYPPAHNPAPAPTAPAAGAEKTSSGKEADGTVQIKSPTVGTYYSAPSPDEPAFVSVGSRVQPETVVCMVEAMKVFNQIPAEVSGTIVEILVNNGDAVEFGQPLFKVKLG